MIYFKNRKFVVSHLYLAPPSEFRSRVSCGKTRMMGLLDDEKSLLVSLAASIQYTNVTDRQTDTARQQRPRYA